MKTIFRTMAILAAALVVVGGIYLFAKSSYGQSFLSSRSEHHGPRGAGGMPPGFSERPDGAMFGEGFPDGERFEGRRGHGDRGPSIFGIGEAIKNLVIIAICVTLFVLGGRLLQGGQRDKPRNL